MDDIWRGRAFCHKIRSEHTLPSIVNRPSSIVESVVRFTGGCEGCIVVWLVGHFRHILGVSHGTVGTDNEHCSRFKTERLDERSVRFPEAAVAMIRRGLYVMYALLAAESRLRKWEVHAHSEHRDVAGQADDLFVELLGLK